MAGLTIDAISLEVQDFTESEPRVRGEDMEAFDNTLRSSVSSSQREFTAVTAPVSASVRDALNAAIENSTPVDVAGDCLESATVECIVKATWQLFGVGSSSFEFVATLRMRATGN